MNVIKTLKKSFTQIFKKRNIAIWLTGSIVFLCALGLFMYHGTKKTVALTLDGDETIVKTHASTIDDLLEDLEITVSDKDYLHPKRTTEVSDELKITWEPAKEVAVTVDGTETMFHTTADTVGELLEEQDIELRQEDEVSTDMETTLTHNMDIAINKAFLLNVVDGGIQKEVWSTSTTVADFLKEQGIIVQPLDRVEPAMDETIKPNSNVHVVRVEKVTDVVEEPINYATVSKKDSSIEKGKEKVLSEGVNGVISNQYEVIKENGKEKKRTLIDQTVIQEKQDKVVAVGTKVIPKQVSRGKEPVSGTEDSGAGKVLYVTSTAYTASCNGCSGVTATGFDLRKNPNAKVIAVDPSVIPLGTKVYVDGYGYAIAADKGSAIKGNKIDVFFASKSRAYQWGKRQVKIRIIQ